MHMPWRRKMRAPESAKDTAWLLGARGDRYAPTQSERPLDQSALGLESLMPLSPLPAYPANVVAPTSRSFVSASVRNFSSDGRTTGKIIVCPKCDTEYHVCDGPMRWITNAINKSSSSAVPGIFSKHIEQMVPIGKLGKMSARHKRKTFMATRMPTTRICAIAALARASASFFESISFCHLTSEPSNGCNLEVSSGGAVCTNSQRSSKPLVALWALGAGGSSSPPPMDSTGTVTSHDGITSLIRSCSSVFFFAMPARHEVSCSLHFE
mmetsp:Transcript_3642/g.7693  ORF Transcript_3642/g.7693 Transcript_3642/m.7693 type:complete len:267 (+) Transcript_3642:257-1057(+)